jgi:hypothetical protein
MIKGLMGTNGVIVDSGNNSLPYVNQSSTDSFQGILRINGNDIQYYSNGAWVTLPTSYATVKLDSSTDSLLQWVRTKQAEEFEKQNARSNLVAKAKTHPSLEKAFEAIQRAEAARDADVKHAMDNFVLLEKIIGEENDYGSEMAESSGP